MKYLFKSTALFLAFLAASQVANAQTNLAPIEISPERRQLIGLQTATVEEKDLVGKIATTGTVEANEQLEGAVQTRFAGWLRQVFVNQTYQPVRKGEPLFTIYSPDLVNTENEYLIAQNASAHLGQSTVDGVANGAQSLTSAALDRLRLFGVPGAEIARLKREGRVREAVEIDSPMTGYVLERNALPNMYVQPDTKLYGITTLSSVWIYAAVFQDQLGEVKVGDPVAVTVDAYPGRSFLGRVDFIWAAIDSNTRTARVRCSFDNPERLLKLGMYVNIAIAPHFGRGLVIPDCGVFRTGTHNVVFVDRGDGYLTPVEVELGAHLNRSFVVLKGLSPGQRIVSSANFLIDSESQLQAAAGSYAPPPPGVSSAAGQPQGQGPSANAVLTSDPNPTARGKNKLTVVVTDSSEKPVSGAQVSVTFYMAAMPAMGMAAMKAQSNLTEQGSGTYTGTIDLQSGGTWQVTVSASKGGQAIAGKQFNVSVSGPMAM
ncbi:MAG TPA: FixH family protein [Candidatus Binataceae bacterium]|jgi:Cu(I)/Ag(I) efflux system membrane fusion protein/cobalt-zinc-cadmium efflux system membrane fusion protein